jgi:ferrochelatase
LAQRTEAQRGALERALDERMPGRWTVVLGQKHAAPFIEDAVGQLADAGVTEAVGLVLAPHYSAFSVGEYQRRAVEAGSARGVAVSGIDHWHLEPAYLDFLADVTREARADLPANHKVLFTAHSLPERVLVGDPYADELRESAAAVAERLALPASGWDLSWQSAGRTPEPWRGPDILESIRGLGATGGCDAVLVCPQGFTSDHLEILYDLDVEARRVASEVGLAFARCRSMNDDPAVMAALADRVIDRLPAAGGR